MICTTPTDPHRSMIENPSVAGSLLPRLASKSLNPLLGVFPVVVVMGARQTGKSTLVQRHPELQGIPYVTLDDLDARDQAVRAPEDLLRRAPRLILDEVQREPNLILAIKRVIDQDQPRRPGRFVLTGSANLLLMNRVSESLAGRASYLNLWPLTRRERLGLGSAGIWSEFFHWPTPTWYERLLAEAAVSADWRDVAKLGGYPTPAHELTTEEQRRIWFAGYVRTYLERDLQILSAIENLVDFRRLMNITALRVGNLLNQTEVGRDAGLPQPTVHRYLNLLETSFQLTRVHPYAVNRTKRLIKSPKVYWSDVGLAMFLAGKQEPTGSEFENLILTDLIAWRDAQITQPEVLFWRTASGREVDFVVEKDGELLAIEVKATSRPSHHDAAHLGVFMEEYADRVRGGLVLHTGTETFWLRDRVLATPWWRVI
jgi:uncharacterized protein